MAFILTKKKVVEWPITINMPVDGGTISKEQCSAKFEIVDQEEYDKSMVSDIDFLIRVVVGFGPDILDENSKPLPCTEDTKRALFSSAGYVRQGFITAYHEAASGIAIKNSNGLPVTGQAARKRRKRK